jgi:hypothetical protein
MNVLLRGLVFIGKAFISREVWKVALSVVRQAAVMFIENDERREWAVEEMKAHGIKEHIARLAVELAVARLKK